MVLKLSRLNFNWKRFLPAMIFFTGPLLLFSQELSFVDVSVEAGLIFDGSQEAGNSGVAAGDFNNDGWTDLFITRTNIGPNRLYKNLGNGQFVDIAVAAGVDMAGSQTHSSLFFDYDGDGWIDLLVPVIDGSGTRLFRNSGDESFEDVSAAMGVSLTLTAFSVAGGDFDRDGDVDLYVAINDQAKQNSQLWRNNGDGSFTNVADTSGILPFEGFDREFTATFADINNDSWPDLLVVADLNTSQVYMNQGDGTFQNVTDREVINDEGGMGSAVGDYDNDGDLDWFVTSIWDPAQNAFAPWGVSSGNRLYRNTGNGVFEDATDEAGVRDGMWGWGSTFNDFNNDGLLDLFHVNGDRHISGPVFLEDPCRFFLNNGDSSFTEKAGEVGLDDRGLAHGVVAFDYDADGDLDLFLANSVTSPKLLRNDNGNLQNAVSIKLIGPAPNTQAIGARLLLLHRDGGPSPIREVHAGNNYLSQNPTRVHMGMGTAEIADLETTWPDGIRNRLYGVRAGERLRIPQIPVSYDNAELSFYQYYNRVKAALKEMSENGEVSPEVASRLRAGAVKAFIENRYGSSN